MYRPLPKTKINRIREDIGWKPIVIFFARLKQKQINASVQPSVWVIYYRCRQTSSNVAIFGKKHELFLFGRKFLYSASRQPRKIPLTRSCKTSVGLSINSIHYTPLPDQKCHWHIHRSQTFFSRGLQFTTTICLLGVPSLNLLRNRFLQQ